MFNMSPHLTSNLIEVNCIISLAISINKGSLMAQVIDKFLKSSSFPKKKVLPIDSQNTEIIVE